MDLKLLLTKLTSLQKEELIRLLSTEQMNSSTDKVLYCPKCGSFHLVKNGKSKGHQYFICKDCGKSFVEYKNTIFSSTKKDILIWKSYIKMMFDGYSIKQIANELKICIQTSFRWRHKILAVLENKFMNDTLRIFEMKTFILVFGGNNFQDTHIQLMQDLKLGTDTTYLPQSNAKIIKTHIPNAFFIIDKNEDLTEGKLSEYFRNLILDDTAFMELRHGQFNLIVKQVTDDSTSL